MKLKDLSLIKLEVLKLLRGTQSRNSLNAKMNFTYDKIGLWESEKRQLLWDEFVQYLKLLNIPYREIFSFHLGHFGNVEDGHNLLRHIIGTTPLTEVASRTEIDHVRLRRVITKQQPKVEEVLILIDTFFSYGKLEEIIRDLCGGKQLKFFEECSRLGKLHHGYVMKDFRYLLLLRMTESEEYRELSKHTSLFFAKYLSMDKRKVEKMLKELFDDDLIEFIDGKYSVSKYFYSHPSIRSIAEASHRYAALQKGLLSSEKSDLGQTLLYYNTFMASEETHQKVSAELVQCFNRIIQIVDEDRGEKLKPLSLNLSLFDPLKSLEVVDE